MSKTVLFQTIQVSISTQFSSIWPIDRTFLSATTPGQSEPESNGNEGVLFIPQSSSITGTSPSDCYIQDTHWREWSYPSAEKQTMYSTPIVDWASKLRKNSGQNRRDKRKIVKRFRNEKKRKEKYNNERKKI